MAEPQPEGCTVGNDTRLLILMSIEPGEPIAGSMAVDGVEREMAFSGWLGLVEVLTVLRRRSQSTPGPAAPGPAAPGPAARGSTRTSDAESS